MNSLLEPEVILAPLPSRARCFWKAISRNKLHLATLLIFVGLLLVAMFAGSIAPFSVRRPAGFPVERPSAKFWLGTDQIGRDVFSRVIYGSRISLEVGFISSGIALLIGVPIGMISGYFGRFVDTVLMRIMDGLLAFPPVILALAAVAVLGPDLKNTIIVVGVVQIPRFARLVRAMTSSLRNREFVLAARALGGSHLFIMTRAVLPNLVPIILVQFTLTFATSVLTEAALSFLGLGAQPPTAEWGLMVAEARPYLFRSAWMMLAPGLAIALLAIGFNLFGDGLRDALNPRA